MAETILNRDKAANASKAMIPYSAEAVDISAANHTFSKPAQLYIGSSGDVVVNMADSGTGITFTGMLGGTWLPCAIGAVVRTGTTASSMVGVY